MKTNRGWVLGWAVGLVVAAQAAGAAEAPPSAEQLSELRAQWKSCTPEALRGAILDLRENFPDRYDKDGAFLKRMEQADQAWPGIAKGLAAGDAAAAKAAAEWLAFRREALLANPLLDFDRLLLIKRKVRDARKGEALGLPQNWQGNCAMDMHWENEIDVLSPVRPGGKLTTLFKPEKEVFVGDVDLDFDAGKLLFSMPGGTNQRWQVWEVRADGTGLRQISPDLGREVDNYDPCYLPDGRILFDSTACVAGVPCVGGGNAVANLMLTDPEGRSVRQLCFDQEHNWCPTVLNDGRILYSRWEYTDTPHYFTRLLFRMNPDGTGQAEYYGSNSYWPNSIFYARPLPGHPSAVVAVISGHHGVPRMGELVVFDPARGRSEADGAIQRIPGHGKKVEPSIQDGLVQGSWPKFLHPYPLGDPATGHGSGKYFLVSCKPTAEALWGVYLVDTFDNMVLLCETEDHAMLEPVPFRATPRPPVIPDRVKLDETNATVYVTDVYAGPGLQGVPRGTVKSLRVYSYHFAYNHMGGHINIGIDGPWDVKRLLGTVPVDGDGSAVFHVPANTPLAVQPLDAQGRALQVMRSWFTAMPGENISCVGCHDRQNAGPSARYASAMRGQPVEIAPWRGPTRGFSFKREVQPVLDRYCVGCHDGSDAPGGREKPDLRAGGTSVELSKKKKQSISGFDAAYVDLHPFVRRPGPESDYRLPMPCEWNVSTSDLVQMLEKGHHNVKLDAEAWDRLVTWIDLNVPDHGTWGEHRQVPGDFHALRMAMRAKFANQTDDPEAILNPYEPGSVKFVAPPPEVPRAAAAPPAVPGWPFDAAEAKKRQESAGLPRELKIELGTNMVLELELIPAGEYVMGDAAGAADEAPLTRVKIEKPFYLGKCEIMNAQYGLFDPTHDSGYVSKFNKDHNTRGEAIDQARQPVVRLSWTRAAAFCDWLSKKSGRRCALPTEAQWEYACRAGAATAMNYGDCTVDFAKLANLADERLAELCIGNSPKWIPRVETVSDGAIVTAPVGNYAPNAWGLSDMHGNAAEWTRTEYRPYPYDPADGRDQGEASGLKVLRGGSFYDRPWRARSAFRLAYPAWQPVYNAGFRVACEAE